MIRALGPGSVSSFLKVILDVFYVVLWVLGLIFAAVILGLLLISFDPQILPAQVLAHASVQGMPPGPLAAVALALVELSLIGVLIIVQRLRRIFGAMTAGDPFHPDNVRRLRVIALVLALVEVNSYLIEGFSHLVLSERNQKFSLDLTGWFAVLVIVVLAEVFREGARLRRDAELTI
ncbi:MAG TPA: DUF2975 domain-containing protein [Caulobacteraceae bacterium]|jgi:hypothetical protein